jgi:hypothetical protein
MKGASRKVGPLLFAVGTLPAPLSSPVSGEKEMSGSPGNTSTGDRNRSPRTGNADITERHGEHAGTQPLRANETDAAGGVGIQESNTKHPQPDDANAAARKSPGK